MPRYSFADNQVVSATELNDLLGQCIRWYDTPEDRAAAYRLFPARTGECTMLGTSPGQIDYWTGTRWRTATGQTFDWLVTQQPPVRAAPRTRRPYGSGGAAVREMVPEYPSALTFGVGRVLGNARIPVGHERVGIGPRDILRPADPLAIGYPNRPEAEAARATAIAQEEAANQVVTVSRIWSVEGADTQQDVVIASRRRADATEAPPLQASQALAESALAAARAALPAGSTVGSAITPEDPADPRYPDPVAYQVSAGETTGPRVVVDGPPAGYQSEAAALAAAQVHIDTNVDDDTTDVVAGPVASETPGTPGTETTSAETGPYTTNAQAVTARTAAVAALPAGTTVVDADTDFRFQAQPEYSAWIDISNGSPTNGPYTTIAAAQTAFLAAFNNLPSTVRAGQTSPLRDADNGPKTIPAVYAPLVTNADSAADYATEALAQAALTAATPAGADVVTSETYESAAGVSTPATSTGTVSVPTTATPAQMAALPGQANSALSAAFGALPSGARVTGQRIEATQYVLRAIVYWLSQPAVPGDPAVIRNSGLVTAADAEAAYTRDSNRGVALATSPAVNSLTNSAANIINATEWPALSQVRTAAAAAEAGGNFVPFIAAAADVDAITLNDVLTTSLISNGSRRIIDSGSITREGQTRDWAVTLSRDPRAGLREDRSRASTSGTAPLALPGRVPGSVSAAGIGTAPQPYPGAGAAAAVYWVAVVAAVPTEYTWTIEYESVTTPARYSYRLRYRAQATAASYWYHLRYRTVTTAQGWYYTITTTAAGTAAIWLWSYTTQTRSVAGTFTYELIYRPPPIEGTSTWYWQIGTRVGVIVTNYVLRAWFHFIVGLPAYTDESGRRRADLMVGMSESASSVSIALYSFDPYAAEIFFTYRGSIDISRSGLWGSLGVAAGVTPAAAGPGFIAWAPSVQTDYGYLWAYADLPDPPPTLIRTLERHELWANNAAQASWLFAQPDGHLGQGRAVFTASGPGEPNPTLYEVTPAYQFDSPLYPPGATAAAVGRIPDGWKNAVSVLSYADGIGEAAAVTRDVIAPRPRRLLGLLSDGSIREAVASGAVTSTTVFADRVLSPGTAIPHGPDRAATAGDPVPAAGIKRMLGLAADADGGLWLAVADNSFIHTGNQPRAWLHRVGRQVPV